MIIIPILLAIMFFASGTAWTLASSFRNSFFAENKGWIWSISVVFFFGVSAGLFFVSGLLI